MSIVSKQIIGMYKIVYKVSEWTAVNVENLITIIERKIIIRQTRSKAFPVVDENPGVDWKQINTWRNVNIYFAAIVFSTELNQLKLLFVENNTATGEQKPLRSHERRKNI